MAKFEENEKVLCYHGPLLYEAKCVRTQKVETVGQKKSNEAGDLFHYFVHYQGWKRTWDEWVPEDRILKMSEQNVALKARLMSEHQLAVKERRRQGKSQGKSSASPLPNSGASTPTPSVATAKASSSKASVEETNSDDEDSSKWLRMTASFHIVVPEELKYVLVSDYDLITQRHTLFNLPAKTSIAQILRDYLQYSESIGSSLIPSSPEILKEILMGIEDLFDANVGSILLYSSECKQFEEMKRHVEANKCRLIDVYGSAHLLRLMVKLNGLLNATSITHEADVRLIENAMLDFLAYLEANRSQYFTSKNYSKKTTEETQAEEVSENQPMEETAL